MASQGRARTRPIPSVESERTSRASSETHRRKRHTVRRVKRTLRHIDPVSVFKLSLFFYGVGMILWLIFVAIVYSMIDATGIFDSIEDVSRGLALGWRVEIDLWFVEKWALLIGVIFWILLSLMNLLIAFLYNVGADRIGGAKLTFVEKDNS